jgi:hypothetical protein
VAAVTLRTPHGGTLRVDVAAPDCPGCDCFRIEVVFTAKAPAGKRLQYRCGTRAGVGCPAAPHARTPSLWAKALGGWRFLPFEADVSNPQGGNDGIDSGQ